MRRLLFVIALAGCAGQAGEGAPAGQLSADITLGAAVTAPARFDESGPLRLLQPAPRVATPEHEPMRLPLRIQPPMLYDRFLQLSAPAQAMPAISFTFEGQGEDFRGPGGTFSVVGVPPDPNGDVGKNHYVQTVNSDITVFDKSGRPLLGPVAINTLFRGFGGLCEQHNDGDPVVLYDQLADRWVVSQFAITIPSGSPSPAGSPYYHCIAVSKTPDPMGAYHRYAYQYTYLNDYPKMGVWPDGYYQTFNMFDTTKAGYPFVGGKLCAYDRAAMLEGKAANQQCFDLGDQLGGVLPADLDGTRLPPAGSPNYMLAVNDSNHLGVWKFQVDWANAANTKLTGPLNLPIASFVPACDDKQGTCIPQPGTSQQLDALSDRLMFRAAYRNFGDRESMVVTHAIKVGTASGIRWYELRIDKGQPVIHQQGTYAPDSNHRWLGSAAMDAVGNMAIGFSVAGDNLKPSIRVAGRLAKDPLNVLARGESVVMAGTGSQLPSLFQPLSRWGDYSMLTVDPADDCTFWFTDQYLKKDGSANWHTRVGSFKLPDCPTAGPPPTSPSVSLTHPQPNDTLAGTVTLTAEASSPQAITKIEFLVDGNPVGSAAASPAQFAWDSKSVADGAHSLNARATDASGWVGTSSPVTLNVKNTGGGGGGGRCPPGTIEIGGICIPKGCGCGSSSADWLPMLALAAFLLRRRRR